MRGSGGLIDSAIRLADEARRMHVHHVVLEAFELRRDEVLVAVVEQRDVADVVDQDALGLGESFMRSSGLPPAAAALSISSSNFGLL